MSLIKRMRRQKAVYWKQKGVDHHGHNSFEEPVEIPCRWENGSDVMRTAQGDLIAYTSTVYVDRPMLEGDMLKRGAMESDVVSDPTKDADARAVQRISEIPNLRATETLYIVYL